MQAELDYLARVRAVVLTLVMGAGEYPIFLALRRGLAQILPLIIAGSFALLLLNLPAEQDKSFPDQLFGPGWRTICLLLQQGSFDIASLAALVSISLNYAQIRRKRLPAAHMLNPAAASVVCLACFLVITLPMEGDLGRRFFSLSGGLPAALLVAVTSTPLYLFFTQHVPFRRFFSAVGADPEFKDTLAGIPAGVVTILLFVLARMLLEQTGLGDLRNLALEVFSAPFKEAENSLGTSLGYLTLSQLLWLFGIHGPNLLFGAQENIFYWATQVNAEYALAGIRPAYVFTSSFLDAFAYIGGSGSTLCLIAAIFLFSKERSLKRLAVIALLPALFNVNEIIMFGLPLVLNPVYAIPFLLTPVVQVLLAYLATLTELVPFTSAQIHWTSPLVLGGYAATGSWSGAVLQLACLAAGIGVYLPFVKLANSIHDHKFRQSMEQLAKAAGGNATSPSGRKCLDLPGTTGRFAEILAGDLRRALESDEEIYLVYQPQVDIDTGRVLGAEVLLRWRHPVHGPIPPHVAVALAEDTGMIKTLGLRILEQACEQQSALERKGWEPPLLSVNMSVLQLEDVNLPAKVAAILGRTGMNPNRLKIEVTESIALKPEAESVSILRRLRENGLLVAIDDFGMGHTSLRYLKEFPVDAIKIDRSLTQETADGVNDQIITSIVRLCKALDIQIIIEGVETYAQLRRFKNHGCHVYQGYLFSKPLSFEDYRIYLFSTGDADIAVKSGVRGRQLELLGRGA